MSGRSQFARKRQSEEKEVGDETARSERAPQGQVRPNSLTLPVQTRHDPFPRREGPARGRKRAVYEAAAPQKAQSRQARQHVSQVRKLGRPDPRRSASASSRLRHPGLASLLLLRGVDVAPPQCPRRLRDLVSVRSVEHMRAATRHDSREPSPVRVLCMSW